MQSWQTFDIFDTVLTRRTARPVDVFTLLAVRLKQEGIRVPPAPIFRRLRMRAERWSRRFEPSYEVSLEDIMRMLGRLLGWSEAQRVRAAELERSLEADCLRATPHGRAAVEAARANGGKVAFVSDMYLDSAFIRSVLEREELIQPEELLAVSGEWKVSKAAGLIWPRLLAELGTTNEHILHRGDSHHSDVDSPSKSGIRSERLGTAEVTRWEEWSPRHRAEDVEKLGGIAALSRLARASCADPENYWTALGAGVLGPMLAGFASWLIDEAAKSEIHTLWFLSRDGWLLYEACRMLEGADAPNLEYFCAGRHQLTLARQARPETTESGLFAGSRRASLGLLATRLSLDEQAIDDLRTSAGLGDIGPDDVLDAAAKSRIASSLAVAPWPDRLVAARKAAGEPVSAYLRQLVDRAEGLVGVVDVGWQGRSQDLLEELFPALKPLRGFYLGLTAGAPCSDMKAGWIFDCPHGVGNRALSHHLRLFEVLLGGVSGPLQGYRQEGGSWHPVFAETEQGEHAPGRQQAQQAAMAFVKLAAAPAYKDWWSTSDLHTFATRNLIRFSENPTVEDARHFADWTVTTDEAHRDAVGLASGYDWKRIRACLRRKEPWAWLWPAAALRNSTPMGRWFMRFASGLRRR